MASHQHPRRGDTGRSAIQVVQEPNSSKKVYIVTCRRHRCVGTFLHLTGERWLLCCHKLLGRHAFCSSMSITASRFFSKSVRNSLTMLFAR